MKTSQLLFILATLCTSSITLFSDGVTVVAALPDPIEVLFDLGSVANLKCPGANTSLDSVSSLSWFVGKDTTTPVTPDSHTSINSAGDLVFSGVRQQDAGWYYCEYKADSGMTAVGRLQLTLIDAKIQVTILNQNTFSLDVHSTILNIPANRMVLFDGYTTAGPAIEHRAAAWRYEGSSDYLQPPFFCYFGHVTNKGKMSLRMAMIASRSNFSGRYEFHVGSHLSKSVTIIIKETNDPVTFPRMDNCDDTFARTLRTPPPPATIPPTMTTTTTTTTTTTSQTAATEPAGNTNSTTFMTVSSSADPTTENLSEANQASKKSSWMYIAIGTGASVVALVLITAIFIYLKQKKPKMSKSANIPDVEKIPQLQLEPLPRPFVNDCILKTGQSQDNGSYPLPRAVQALESVCDTSQPSPSPPDHTDMQIHSDTRCSSSSSSEYDDSAQQSPQYNDLMMQQSTNSIDEVGASPHPSIHGSRAQSQATMLTNIHGDKFDSSSLPDYSERQVRMSSDLYTAQQNQRNSEHHRQSLERSASGRSSSGRSASGQPASGHCAIVTSPHFHKPHHLALDGTGASANSCPTQRRSDVRPASAGRGAESPLSAANIAITPDQQPSPALSTQPALPRAVSSLSRGPGQLVPSPLVYSTPRRDPEDPGSFRSSPNIAVPAAAVADMSSSSEASPLSIQHNSRTRMLPPAELHNGSRLTGETPGAAAASQVHTDRGHWQTIG